ncbi:MAG TPA: response regulator, partial [Verrucomicrobiae bacterium]|nr:response regulator [Verrucomicrobiae bacterium]
VALRKDSETAAIPFIFLTAKGEKPDVRAGMDLGADAYLTKPVAKKDLLEAIDARLRALAQTPAPTLTSNHSTTQPLEQSQL